MINTLINSLHDIALNDENVTIISVDDSELYDGFKDLGKQYVCAGISEMNMVAVAAGISSVCGPTYVLGGGTFLAYRAAEFIRNEVAMQNRNVIVIGIGAGLAISFLGSTHHCTEDLGILTTIPNLRVITPATPKEVEECIKHSYFKPAPSYIRVGRSVGEDFYQINHYFSPDKIQQLVEGKKIAIFSTGSIVCDMLNVVKRLREQEIDVALYNVHTIRPLDICTLKQIAKETHLWFTVEEHNVCGGLGTIIADAIVEEKMNADLYKIGLANGFSKGHGGYTDIKKSNGISEQIVYERISKVLDSVCIKGSKE